MHYFQTNVYKARNQWTKSEAMKDTLHVKLKLFICRDSGNENMSDKIVYEKCTYLYVKKEKENIDPM